VRKTFSYLLILLIVLFAFSSVTFAAPEPSPVVDDSGDVFFVDWQEWQQQILQAQARLAALMARFTPDKTTLSEAEQNALGNMTVGDFFAVGFKLPESYGDQPLIWSSNNPDVASVVFLNGRGLVNANAPGTAVITVRTADGSFSYSFTVVVN
jgi:hypothetical protein